MASEPGAVSDDPDALKHTAVMLDAHDNNDESITTVVEPTATVTAPTGSAACTAAPATDTASDNEKREETRAVTAAKIQDSKADAGEQRPSLAKSGGDVSSNLRDAAPNSPDEADKAIGFPFSTSNQLNEQSTDSSSLQTKDYANSQVLSNSLSPEQYVDSSAEHASMEALPSTTTSLSKRPAPLPLSPTQPFSWNDILRVQNMIERCLQQYLSKTEILQVLEDQAQVDPEFTNVVWLKLQEQNPSFFRAYSILLQLKEQIVAFNFLVAQQKDMMQSGSTGMSLLADASLPPLLQVGMRGYGTRDAMNISDKVSSSQAVPQLPLATTSLPQPTLSQPQQPIPFESEGSNSSSNDTAPTASDHFVPSPLPLPSPIKTDLDTHAFFT